MRKQLDLWEVRFHFPGPLLLSWSVGALEKGLLQVRLLFALCLVSEEICPVRPSRAWVCVCVYVWVYLCLYLCASTCISVYVSVVCICACVCLCPSLDSGLKAGSVPYSSCILGLLPTVQAKQILNESISEKKLVRSCPWVATIVLLTLGHLGPMLFVTLNP